MAHKCPPWCHRCPLMGGDVMPGCMGTAASASDPKDMSRCTCDRPKLRKKAEKKLSVERRLAALERQVAEMMEMLKQAKG